MKNNTYYKISHQLLTYHRAVMRLPYEKREAIIMTLLTIRRLALKHRRLAEMSCNGQGFVRGVLYTTGPVSSAGYEKAQYGLKAKSAYAYGGDNERTIFDIESDAIEKKIHNLAVKIGFSVEFQGDPRGMTVKLAYKGRNVEIF
mgnify:CR=1 FL=1